MNDLVRILLVEDNPGDADLTKETLESGRLHAEISVVIDGEQAVAYLSRKHPYETVERPDLVLLDLNLPKMNGQEVLAEIKRKGLEEDENALFFGRYYAGLDEELLGHHARALELLSEAVAGPTKGGVVGLPYMWQVARVHLEVLRQGK